MGCLVRTCEISQERRRPNSETTVQSLFETIMAVRFELIGERLRRLIRDRGYAQKAFAEELGIDQGRLSNMLSGAQPTSVNFVAPIALILDLNENEELGLVDLISIAGARDQLEKLLADDEFRKFGDISRELAPLLLTLVNELSDADQIDRDRPSAKIYIEHLRAAGSAIKSVINGGKDQGTALFHPGNIRPWLRYPAHLYIGFLMSLTDHRVAGGQAFSEHVREMVQDSIEMSLGLSFLEKVTRQHAHHVNARYGGGEPGPGEREALRSGDIQGERMILFGRAFSQGAGDAAVDALHDALRNENFRTAVLSFDASHYDRNLIERDGFTRHPTIIVRTVLQYLSGLTSDSPHIRAFAATRLQIVIDHASPAMLRNDAIASRARIVADVVDLPAEAVVPLNYIKTTNSKT